MNDLITKVIAWANERNIIQGSTAIKQLDKTSEEFNELQRAVATIPYGQEYYLDLGYGPYADAVYEDVDDAFGDILVTLIIAAAILHRDLPTCLEKAYDTIKHRKGTMINGKFVKESDL